jgi:hypothetical protein
MRVRERYPLPDCGNISPVNFCEHLALSEFGARKRRQRGEIVCRSTPINRGEPPIIHKIGGSLYFSGDYSADAP